ncbi:MAG: hypothetical protein DMF06_09730 [Verrucomicrobia bacterium]|nr:MAG: hypothetical protein DMF06_09730 [Verrucomicrobiota bacterium]
MSAVWSECCWLIPGQPRIIAGSVHVPFFVNEGENAGRVRLAKRVRLHGKFRLSFFVFFY